MKLNINIEDIKYIKIGVQDETGSSTTIRSAIKRMDDREMVTCSKYEDNLRLKLPQDITMSLVCNDGLYRTKTKLKSFENDEPYAFFYIETPQNIEYQQNREYFRVSMVYDCSYTAVLNYEPITVDAKTIDISANGVSILASHLIISNNDIDLLIKIKDKIIKTKSRYVRSESFGDGYKISFMYTKISEHDRDIISQVCIAKQLEQKRSRLV